VVLPAGRLGGRTTGWSVTLTRFLGVEILLHRASRGPVRNGNCSIDLCTVRLAYQPAVFFSQNKPATSNQPTVFFSQNKSAPAASQTNPTGY
jgi:hypothetical protein